MNSRALLSLAWLSATLVMMIVTYSAVNLVGSSVTDQPIQAANTIDTTIADRVSDGGDGNSTTSTADRPSPSEAATPPTFTTTPSGGSSTGDGIEASGGTDGSTPTTPATTSTTVEVSTTTPTTAATTSTTATPEHDDDDDDDDDEGEESSPETTGPFPVSSGGGVITVSCTGDNIKFLGATPSAGYSMQVEESGPGRVKVRFTSSENKWEIEVRCSDGAIDPKVEQNDL